MTKTKQASSKSEKRPAAPEVADRSPECRILILAPTGNDARLTADFLNKEEMSPQVCRDAAELCVEVEKGCGAILLAEETLGHSSIMTLVRALSQQPAWSDIPVTIITSGGEANQLRLRRLTIFGPSGNVSLLERPFRPSTLVSSMEVALRGRQRQYEARRMMEALSDARARMEATLGAADVGTWVWDIPNNRVVADRNLARLFSLSLQDFAEGPVEKFIEAIHPEDQQRVKAAIAVTLENEKKEFEIDCRISQVNGSIRWVTARGRVERDDQGRPVRFPGVVIDISERKQQQNALAILTKKIEDQARVFNTTLSHINDFAYIFDLGGRFLYANQPLLNHWGLTLAQTVGKNFFELHYPNELATKLQRQIQQVITTKKAVRDEMSYTGTTGVEGYYEYIFNPVLVADQSVEMVVGSTRDITEYKRHQAELLAASHAKDDFMAALSHELRTPLNPVLLLASEAAEDARLPVEVRAKFTTIRNNVELEARLIDDLLDITRITHGKLSLSIGLVDVNTVVEEALTTVQPELDHKRIELVKELAAKQSTVKGDAVRLQQVFWNVFKNAVKFTPAGGKIIISTHTHGDGALIVTVTDTGIGMASSELTQIFDAFAQGEHVGRSHRFGGLGLGLAISRKLVELHAGRIQASSDGQDKGSTFTITLPLTTERANGRSMSPNDSSPPLASRDGPVNTMHILLVEDHEPTRTALAQLLTRRHYEVKSAASVAEARKFSQHQEFQLLISDIGLPDGNGFELMEELRAGNTSLQGIALTGYGMEEDVARSQNAGFVSHLTKPIRVQSLELALAKIMRS